MDSLIRTYKNALPKELCEHIIELFEQNPDKIKGITSGGINETVKSSTDLIITNVLGDEKWQYVYDYLRENLLGNLVDYLKHNPFVGVNESLSSDEVLVRTAQSVFGSTNIDNPHMQMQRYIGNEGYYAWHHENEGGVSSNRQLFYIYYLNNNDGFTEFRMNREQVKPETGKLILSPAYWTHRHKGHPPGEGQNKYIITGWIEYQNNNIHQEFPNDFLI
jgi:hypothetical protein